MSIRSAAYAAYRVVRYEIRLYISLARWLARRPSIPDSGTPVGYAKATTPVVWLWIFASALEIPLIHVLVPWEAIDSLTTRRGDLPSSARAFQPEETERRTHLRIGVSGQVNVHAGLVSPLTVRTPSGPMEIVELSFLVDDPRSFVRQAREYVDADAVSRARRSGR